MNEFYGPFGGAFVAETLIRNLEELKRGMRPSARTGRSLRRSTGCCGSSSAGRRRSRRWSG